jgi:hypothetical protein
VDVRGFSKGAIRIRGDSSNIVIGHAMSRSDVPDTGAPASRFPEHSGEPNA